MLAHLLLSLLFLALNPGGPRLLEDQPLKTVDTVQVRRWIYTSDGLQVRGQLFVPRVAAGTRLPVVVFCHDGISGISREHQLSSARLARAGFVVFAPSYRGEDGSQGQIEIAKGEVRDVLNVLPLLDSVPQADTSRLGLAGASHGALICVLAASQSRRVKALVVAYGVMDIYSWWDYLNRVGKLGHDAITERTYGRGPQERPESFSIRHALAVADKITCPVLLLQGEKDDIVPPDQAVKFQQALQAAGRRAQLELYPDCLHGFLVYVPYLDRDVDPKERQQTERSWQVMVSFLDRTLKNGPGQPDTSPSP